MWKKKKANPFPWRNKLNWDIRTGRCTVHGMIVKYTIPAKRFGLRKPHKRHDRYLQKWRFRRMKWRLVPWSNYVHNPFRKGHYAD